MKYFNFITCLILFLDSVSAQSPYKLPELGYSYAALEPYIDSATMNIHYNKHHLAYINNLNNALKDSPDSQKSLIEILNQIGKYSEIVRNNAGGHYNHSLFWKILTPIKNTQPDKYLMEDILKTFTSIDSLKTLMNKAAASRFGSGWAWLYLNADKKLSVGSSPNQDNPLMDVSPIKGVPIMGIDVWEHAYYLKYQNRRGDYLSAIWNVINWDEVNKRYHEVIPIPKGKFDDWPEIKLFHEVMAATFHSAEEGDMSVIRSRSGELATKAASLSTSKIPKEFLRKELTDVLKLLADGTKSLDKLVKKKASDKSIRKSLNSVHDNFHKIMDQCK